MSVPTQMPWLLEQKRAHPLCHSHVRKRQSRVSKAPWGPCSFHGKGMRKWPRSASIDNML